MRAGLYRWVLPLFVVTWGCGDAASPSGPFDDGVDASVGSGMTTGGSGGTSPTTSGRPDECEGSVCDAPAVCRAFDGQPRCVCPGGYVDTMGDGSRCVDIDECAEGTDDCHPLAVCVNTAGSFECECEPPARVGSGRGCACAPGYDEIDGECTRGCQEDADCDDGRYCNGAERCNGERLCAPGTPVDCDDGVGCTVDACDEDANTCSHTADDGACDNGEFCDGAETCDVEDGCQAAAEVDCDDDVACTVDACDENEDVCAHTASCDDGNPCTDDACDADDGCVHVNNTAACDDGDVCTMDDVCQDGACTGGTALDCDDGNLCTDDSCDSDNGCEHANNSVACDDGQSCSSGDVCQDGVCAGTPNQACDDGNPCTTNSCNDATGCVYLDNAASCDDGSACTTADVCSGGSCFGGAPPDCDDDNVCTDDACDDDSGCVHANNTVGCDDGDACTTADTCSAGACVGGAPPDCDDDNVCTDDACDAVDGCVYENNTASCDDGSACTSGDVCAAGTCGGTAADCDDGNPCTDDTCDVDGGCVHTNNTVGCDDGDACTTADTCSAGACVGGAPPDCDDGNGCTDDSCDAGSGCVHQNNAAACDDGQACTSADVCQDGVCAGTPNVSCDDGNPCTTDSCDDTGGCVFLDNTASCDDSDVCTTVDRCMGGGCVGTTPPDCDDGNACTDDACDPVDGCQTTNNTASCDDGDMCTTSDACSGGACAGGAAPDCDDGNACTDDSCDSASGCLHANNTAACDDSDACTTADTCASGACVGGAAPDCDDGNVCTDDSCDSASGCVNDDNTVACDDDDVCTTVDACSGGDCVGTTALDCDDGNACTTDTCDPVDGCANDGTGVTTVGCMPDANCEMNFTCQGDAVGTCLPATEVDCSGMSTACAVGYCDPADGVCKASPLAEGDPCDDVDACTDGETCMSGLCTGGSAVDCSDPDPCKAPSCDSALGCVQNDAPNGTSCDDGDPCTESDECFAGQCIGGDPPDCLDPNPCVDGLCDSGDFDGDPCYTQNNSDACDDGHPCTATDVCSGGTCTGSGNGCGPGQLTCVENGPDRECTCMAGYDGTSGYCVAVTDECLLDPCDDNPVATCVDPTPDGSDTDDFVCTCPSGYSGNGRGANGCLDINECASDPCGVSTSPSRASSCANGPGDYSCSCRSGYVEIDDGTPTCACNLAGTFALRVSTSLSWSGIDNIADGSATVHAWTLRTHTYDANGVLHVEEALQCGATTQTACGLGVTNDFGEDIPPESYSQFVTNQVWGTGSMLTNEFVSGDGLTPSGVTMSLPNVIPGSAFLPPQTVALLGISLSNPFGGWPSGRANVTGGGGTVTNGATWANHDAAVDVDDAPAATPYVVPPGGIGDNNSIPDSPIDYAPTACGGDPYNYLPAPEFVFPITVAIRRLKRVFSGSRATTQLVGSVSASSCDVITGNVVGPGPGGMPRFDAVVQGCIRVTSGSGETACSGAILDFLESSAGSGPTVTSSTFRMERIDVSGAANDNAACDMVRSDLCFSPGACN